MPKDKAVEDMSLDELVAEREALAAERTKLRLRQVAIEEALAFQQAMSGMPEGLRQRVRLEGGMNAKGGQA